MKNESMIYRLWLGISRTKVRWSLKISTVPNEEDKLSMLEHDVDGLLKYAAVQYIEVSCDTYWHVLFKKQ